MKITASKLDELRQARDEWDARRDESDKRYSEQTDAYEAATDAVLNPIKNRLESDLSKFDLLDFDVNLRTRTDYHQGTRTQYIDVNISCNESFSSRSSKPSALSWTYKVKLDEGQVVRETNSWSGLNATTEEYLASLKQTVEALEYLASIDWETLIRTELPKWGEYVTERGMLETRPNFEQQIKEEEIKEYIGQRVLLKGDSIEALTGWRRGGGWYSIHRETPKKYIVSYITDSAIKYWETEGNLQEQLEIRHNYRGEQIKKEYLLEALDYPFETFEF